MENNKIYMVKNRSASRTIYRIPEDNIRREFAPGEVKKIGFSELEKLTFQPGGIQIMSNFLQIMSEEATQELGIKTEPEYNMSEQDIVELLKFGSLDAFLDCLDFAPIGVKDIIKKLAVSLPLEDYEKRKALKEKMGFDVDKALAHIQAEKAEENKPADSTPSGRRVQSTETSSGRRTVTPNYKVVSRDAE